MSVRAAWAVVAALGLQACATNGATAELREAVLLNPEDNAVRENLRVIVRQDGGDALRIDPDSLAQSPILRVDERPMLRGSEPRITAPTPVYRLMSGRDGACYLSRDGETPTVTRLTQVARCRALAG